jgi:tripartite-type tricarboxylate transporter receptor subunit TctC
VFQLTSELFNQKTGAKSQHIPFKNGAEFVTAVLTRAGDHGVCRRGIGDAAVRRVGREKARPIASAATSMGFAFGSTHPTGCATQLT